MLKGKELPTIRSKGQYFSLGLQVAYISPWSMTLPETYNGATTFGIQHGKLTVSKIKKIVQAEFVVNPITELHLEDGTVIDVTEAVVTDGKFSVCPEVRW